jgi:hypothetical protein
MWAWAFQDKDTTRKIRYSCFDGVGFFFRERLRDSYDYIASRLSNLHSHIKACSTRSLSAVKLTHGELAIYVRLAYWVAFGKDGVSLL